MRLVEITHDEPLALAMLRKLVNKDVPVYFITQERIRPKSTDAERWGLTAWRIFEVGKIDHFSSSSGTLANKKYTSISYQFAEDLNSPSPKFSKGGGVIIHDDIDNYVLKKVRHDGREDYFFASPKFIEEWQQSRLDEDLFADRLNAKKAKLKSSGIWLTRVNKDGTEHRGIEGTKHFWSKDEAVAFHNLMVQNNPGKEITHNLHVSNDLGNFVMKLSGKYERKK